MKDSFKIVSMTNTRVRIKILLRGDEGVKLLNRIKDLFVGHKSIKITKINHISRGLVFEHDNESNEIERLLGGLDLDYSKTERVKAKDRLPHMRNQLKYKLINLDNKIQGFTDGEIDLDMVIAIFFVGLSTFQVIRRGRILPPVEEMLAKGMKHFLQEQSYLD